MTKTIIMVKSANNEYTKFNDYLQTHFPTHKEKYECNEDFVCVGQKLGSFFRNDKKDTLIIYNPTDFILSSLVDIDKLDELYKFVVYRIYLGDDIPANFDFVVNDNFEKNLDFIFSIEKEN